MRWKKHLRLFWILPPLAIGIGTLFMSGQMKTPPKQGMRAEVVRYVDIQTVQAADYTPTATGYGTVQATEVWQAISEVAGQITAIHPQVRDGGFVQQGAILVRIDPTEYQAAIDELEATIANTKSQQASLQKQIDYESRIVALMQTALTRQKKLKRTGASASATVDSAQQALLQQQSTLASLQNSLAQIPNTLKSLSAQLRVAQQNLERTTLVAPFDLRLGEKSIALGQYVTKGQTLFSGVSPAAVEVRADITADQMAALLGDASQANTTATTATDLSATLHGITATVYPAMASHGQARPASVRRLAQALDQSARTYGIMVDVPTPLDTRYGPPLLPNSYVRVEFARRTPLQGILIPRAALHGNTVYLLTKDNTLAIKPVKIDHYEGDMAVITDGLQTGDSLILTDLVPASAGMKLKERPQTPSDT